MRPMPIYAHCVAVLAVAFRVPLLLPRLPTHLVNFLLTTYRTPSQSHLYLRVIGLDCYRMIRAGCDQLGVLCLV